MERVDIGAETVTFRRAVAVRRPVLPHAPRQRRIYLDLPVATYAALTHAAQRHQLPRNALVHQIVTAWLDAEQAGSVSPAADGRR